MGGPQGDETLRSGASGATSAERFAIGSIAAGRYRIERFIAAGGMGEVYAAHDLVLDTAVALKTLRPELEGSADAIARLRREIALARSVTDPHICRLHDVGEHDGRVFLSMELLEGRTLAEVVQGQGLALDAVNDIGRQLVAGLGALHRASIIHRDFKTSNVIVVGEGANKRAVITDFGLARSIDAKDSRLTVESGLLGTPAYMAPEQVEARAATKASDIYSLGIVLFELLTGKLPFDEDTAMATATARLTKDPPRPSSLRSEIPARWDAIVLRCLERDPAKRFATVDDILAHEPAMSRRWFVAAGGGAVAAAALGVWRFTAPAAEDTPAIARSPNEIVAVLPVLGEGSWLTDAWRSAITFDLHDALATVGVPILALHSGAMNLTAGGAAARVLAEQDPVAAALAFPDVTTVVTMTLARSSMEIVLTVTMAGRASWRRRFARPLDEAAYVVHDVATAIAGTLGYPLPRLALDTPLFDARLYERFGAGIGSLHRGRTRDERKAIREGREEPPDDILVALHQQRPELSRVGTPLADRMVMNGEQQEAYADTERFMTRAAATCDRTLARDPSNALAYAVRGHAAMVRWDWRRADEDTKRGYELAPTHERVFYHRNVLLMLTSRFDEAIPAAERAHARNPKPHIGKALLGWHYYYARRWEALIEAVEPVLERIDFKDLVQAVSASMLPLAYADMTRFDDAIRTANFIRGKVGDNYYVLGGIVPAYALAGRTEDARAIRDQIGSNVDLDIQAIMADSLGEIEPALALLEQLVERHRFAALFLKVERYSVHLRAHPRFQKLLERIGFP